MKKSYWIFVGITGIFLCVLLGIFVGRNLINSYNVIQIVDGNHTNKSTTTDPAQDGRIDINTASIEQLTLLSGIGETLAQRIIDYRTEHNGFTSIDELLQVNGIGEKKLEDIKPYIKVESNYENSGS